MNNEIQPSDSNQPEDFQSTIATEETFFQKYVVKNWYKIRDRFMAWVAANPRGRWAIKIMGGVIAAGVSFVLVLTFLIWIGAFGKLPSKTQLKNVQNETASEIFSDDNVLLGKYFKQNRVNVDFEEISPYFVDALVATEDARFFNHGGIDYRAWVRVFFKTILMQDQSGGGGSTISQQLAKNLYKRKRYRFLEVPINKIREMMIARRLEKVYSKEDLLTLYLNPVPFSRNIYGGEILFCLK